MIKSAKFRNFQSHAETTLNFCPGINAIVGSSDSGKSALLRGIGWCIYNRPTGESFLRRGEKVQ